MQEAAALGFPPGCNHVTRKGHRGSTIGNKKKWFGGVMRDDMDMRTSDPRFPSHLSQRLPCTLGRQYASPSIP